MIPPASSGPTPADAPPVSARGRAGRAGVRARLTAYGRPPRVLGVDVARGLAMIGMFGAHLGDTHTPLDWTDASTWSDVVNGRSAILFALLAGVSIALLSGGRTPPVGAELRAARTRILLRGAVVLLLGTLLELLQTGVAVILPVYGVLFLLAVPALRVPPRILLLVAAALAVLSPLLNALLGDTLAGVAVLDRLFGNYPVDVWIAFVLVGIAVGRLDLGRPAVGVRLALTGAALAAVGYGVGVLAAGAIGGRTASTGSAAPAGALGTGFDWASLLTVEPHSGSPFEMVGSTGVALAVLGLCLRVSVPLRWLLLPLAAVGAMPLSAYTGHLLAIPVTVGAAGVSPDDGAWLAFSLVAMLLCTAWFVLLGRGPLERLVALVVRLGASQPNTARTLD